MNSTEKAFIDQQTELGQLIEERSKLECRISRLQTSLRALSNLLDESNPWVPALVAAMKAEETGFTETIRRILRETFPKGLRAAEIRDELTARGCPMDKQSNPLASIHTVLRRLIANGDVDKTHNEGEDSIVTWIPRTTAPPSYGTPSSLANQIAEGKNAPAPPPRGVAIQRSATSVRRRDLTGSRTPHSGYRR